MDMSLLLECLSDNNANDEILIIKSQQDLEDWKSKTNYSFIREIHIGSKVKEIPLFCFEKLNSLENIYFENGLKYIGEYSLTCNRVRYLKIPDSVQYIGHCAFCQDEYLEHVDLGKGLIYLEDYVFPECRKLKKIELPSSLIGIDENAFTHSGIEHYIVQPHSVAENFVREKGFSYELTGTPLDMFGKCGDSLKWHYDKSNQELSITGTGKMWNYGWKHRAPWRVFPVKNVFIGEGVESIGRAAFLLCLFLKKVSLPESMVYISDNAFSHCVSLREIETIGCVGDFYTKNDCFYQGNHMLSDFNCSWGEYERLLGNYWCGKNRR